MRVCSIFVLSVRPSTHSTVPLQKADSQLGLSLSMSLSPLAGVLRPRGHLLIRAVLCPTNPNPCSLLSPAQTTWTLQLHCGIGLCWRRTFLSPSPLGLWPPPPPCQGRGLTFSRSAHLHHAWTMPGVWGKVTGQEGPKNDHHHNKYFIISMARH